MMIILSQGNLLISTENSVEAFETATEIDYIECPYNKFEQSSTSFYLIIMLRKKSETFISLLMGDNQTFFPMLAPLNAVLFNLLVILKPLMKKTRILNFHQKNIFLLFFVSNHHIFFISRRLRLHFLTSFRREWKVITSIGDRKTYFSSLLRYDPHSKTPLSPR